MYWSRPCYRVLPSFFFNGRFFSILANVIVSKWRRIRWNVDFRRFVSHRFVRHLFFVLSFGGRKKKTKQKSNAEGQKGFGGNEWNVFSYPITSQRCKKKQSLCRFLGLSLILPSFTGFSVKNGSNFT